MNFIYIKSSWKGKRNGLCSMSLVSKKRTNKFEMEKESLIQILGKMQKLYHIGQECSLGFSYKDL